MSTSIAVTTHELLSIFYFLYIITILTLLQIKPLIDILHFGVTPLIENISFLNPFSYYK